MEEGQPQNRRRLHRLSQGSGGQVLCRFGLRKRRWSHGDWVAAAHWRERLPTGEKQSTVRDYQPTAPSPLQPPKYPPEPPGNPQNPAYKPILMPKIHF